MTQLLDGTTAVPHPGSAIERPIANIGGETA